MQTNVARTTMSSREIAELTGKQHKHVLADIRNMLLELKLDTAEFSAVYQADNGQSYECFNINRALTETLLTGYSIPLRHKVIMRLQELEAGAARIASFTDPRIDMIASLLDRGLITKAQADQRVMQLLDDAIPLKASAASIPAATRVVRIGGQLQKANWVPAQPSGVGVIPLYGDQKMRFSEMGQWVKGGQREMVKTLVAAGLFAESGRHTPKGVHLFAGNIKGSSDFHVYAAKLLKAIGAWPSN